MNLKVNTLALDIGTKTGWSISSGGVVGSGTFETATQKEILAQKKQGFERRLDLRFARLFGFVRTCIAEHSIGLVIFEDVIFCSSQSQAQLWGRLSGAVWAGVEISTPKPGIIGVPVGTLKLFATGNGSAQKEDMLSAFQRVHPEYKFAHTPDDNEIDALWLMAYAKAAEEGRVAYSSIWERKRQRQKDKREKLKFKLEWLKRKSSSSSG